MSQERKLYYLGSAHLADFDADMCTHTEAHLDGITMLAYYEKANIQVPPME